MTAPLSPGDSLGPYTIEAQVGAGAMGTVYRARDGRLQRTVAIKVMTAGDAHGVQADRFRQEAVAIAALNDSHICAIYDVGVDQGINFLVMEFVDGETIADRLARGAMPMAQAVELGRQLAVTLDRAHRAGIIHRDLKPANVMLTREGPKLMDFGLATMRQRDSVASTATLTQQHLTTPGMIVGTVPYMAPEVLEGHAADARSDIFALGAMLFEMLTGRRAFPGDVPTTIIAAILTSTPPPLSQIITGSTPLLDRALRRCFAKDPDQRWQNARDLALELQDWDAAGLLPAAGAPRASRMARTAVAIAALIAALAVGAFGGGFANRAAAVPPSSMKFRVPAPDGVTFTLSEAGRAGAQLAVSPDGHQMAFVAATGAGPRQLWIQSLDSITAAVVPNTDGAAFPFWAPDGTAIAFFAGGKLVRVSPGGGNLQILCDAPVGLGGTWSSSGTILFSSSFGRPISRVSAVGGEVSPVTALVEARQETDHAWPQFLSDQRHFVFGVRSKSDQHTGVYLGDVNGPAVTLLTNAASRGIVMGDQLLFWREGRLLAQTLDMRTLTLTGEPELVADDVARGPFIRYASAAAGGGTIAYQPSMRMISQLTWVDRGGNDAMPVGDPGEYFNLSLSPDERAVALSTIAAPSADRDIWTFDLNRGSMSRLTSETADDMLPVWSPDGSQIAFVSNRSGLPDIYRRSASGGGSEELLLKSATPKFTSDWSADNRYILFDAILPATRFDIWAYALGSATATPLINTRFIDRQGKFSHDGKWIAFVSEETGRPEVYVQQWPATAQRWQISAKGGSQPMWRDDGRELFFLDLAGAVMSVALPPGSQFTAGLPVRLFDSGILNLAGGADSNQYAVAKHGQRFLVNRSPKAPSQPPLTVVTNWSRSRR